MEILVSGLIGALIGSMVTGGLHIWKFRRDELSARCDEFCKAIQDAAAVASEYWSSDYAKLANPKVSEAKLLGAQDLCDGLYASLRVRLPEQGANELDRRMSEFVDRLTGGEFSVEGRAADPTRTRESIQTAAAMVVDVRNLHHQSIPLSNLVNRVRENRNRQIDLSPSWVEGQKKIYGDKDCK